MGQELRPQPGVPCSTEGLFDAFRVAVVPWAGTCSPPLRGVQGGQKAFGHLSREGRIEFTCEHRLDDSGQRLHTRTTPCFNRAARKWERNVAVPSLRTTPAGLLAESTGSKGER